MKLKFGGEMHYFDMANTQYRLENYDKAIDLYKKAIYEEDNEISSLYNTAVCYIKLHKYENAICFLKIAISKKADSKYYYNLGFCYSMLNNTKKALIYFNTAWAIDNEDADCEKAVTFILNKYKKK